MKSPSLAARPILPVLLLLLGGTLAVFWPILPDLWASWREDSNNSHGVLVPAIAAYLAWSKRRDVRQVSVRPSAWGLALWLLALALYLAALKTHLAFPARVALVASMAGLVWWNLGTAAARHLWFPLAFLGFMVPVPESVSGTITFPLQLFVSSASARVLAGLGISVLHEGNMLYVANTALEVAEACSGIRSLVSYLAIGALLAHLEGGRMGKARKAVLLLSTIPLALGANVLRVTGTGVLAAYLGPGIARGFLHEFSGFAVFALGFLLLWAVSVLLGSGSAAAPAAARSAVPAPRPMAGTPRTLIVSLVVLLTAGASAWAMQDQGQLRVVQNRLNELPREILGYSGTDRRFQDSVYAVLNNDFNLLRRYSDPAGRAIWLYVGYYGTAKGGRPSHVPASCYTGQGYAVEDWTLMPAPAGQPGERINRMIVKRRGERQLVLFWFQSDGSRVLGDGFDQNLLRLRNRLVDGRDDGSLIRVSAAIPAGEDARVSGELLAFAGELQRRLPGYWPVEARLR